jgi:hypothetical protein
VPNGFEVGASVPAQTDPNLIDQFLILSDDNRGAIDINQERLEQRQRTINGRMRSYHIADKLKFSWSWNLLPSRAGGVEILDWYENHKGPFWMYLAYDKYSNFGDDNAAFGHLAQYNQIVQVYFADFSYSIVKRGGNNFDFWNISVTLEEV